MLTLPHMPWALLPAAQRCTPWGGLSSGRAAPVRSRATPKAQRKIPRDPSHALQHGPLVD
eukprot:4231522-Amphidinium_carterae.1